MKKWKEEKIQEVIIRKFLTCGDFFIINSFSLHSLTEIRKTRYHPDTSLKKQKKEIDVYKIRGELKRGMKLS